MEHQDVEEEVLDDEANQRHRLDQANGTDTVRMKNVEEDSNVRIDVFSQSSKSIIALNRGRM